MADVENFESILKEIDDSACQIVAQKALQSARKALEMSESDRKRFISDEVDKVMPRALKLRTTDETA